VDYLTSASVAEYADDTCASEGANTVSSNEADGCGDVVYPQDTNSLYEKHPLLQSSSFP